MKNDIVDFFDGCRSFTGPFFDVPSEGGHFDILDIGLWEL